MMKKILIIVGYSIVFTSVIATILFLTKNLFLDRFVYVIMKVRGTANYEGEARGAEVWNIIIGMIIPAIFFFTLVIAVFLNRKKNKSR
jgi:hypothetical protein